MATLGTSLDSPLNPSQEEWDAWHSGRLTYVVSPAGNLALVETRWQSDDKEITIEEALVGQPSTVTATEMAREDFDGNVVAKGVRLWDTNSAGIQAFETIDAYPFDPAWVFEGTFSAHAEPRAVPFEYVRGVREFRNLAVSGEIKVNIQGTDYSIDAFDDDGGLYLVFADPTNGDETYPAGRFLDVARNENTDRVIVDFNRAYVPPCGFSIAYNCPLAPPQNRIKVHVRAGEKKPVFRNNFDITQH